MFGDPWAGLELLSPDENTKTPIQFEFQIDNNELFFFSTMSVSQATFETSLNIKNLFVVDSKFISN